MVQKHLITGGIVNRHPLTTARPNQMNDPGRGERNLVIVSKLC